MCNAQQTVYSCINRDYNITHGRQLGDDITCLLIPIPRKKSNMTFEKTHNEVLLSKQIKSGISFSVLHQ